MYEYIFSVSFFPLSSVSLFIRKKQRVTGVTINLDVDLPPPGLYSYNYNF